MSATNIMLKGFEAAFKTVFKSGVLETANKFAPHAGRLLQKGDGSVMKTLNDVRRAVTKM